MDLIQAGVMWILIIGAIVYSVACIAAFSGLMKSGSTVEDFSPSVTVIVAARNEEKSIGSLLTDLTGQEYPPDRLRIIVVDDCSEDGTAAVVQRFMAIDCRIELRSTGTARSLHSHKKRAIHEGIVSSIGEIIMTTDADCRLPRNWVSGMVKHFTAGVDLVAGMVLVEGTGLLGRLEALESTGIQCMAAGLMNAGLPVTCNGANLAYRRSAFDRVKGFEEVGTVVSGDDDLLMQKIARGDSSGVVFAAEPETAVRTEAATSPRQFFNQRARWASKTANYPSAAARGLLVIFFVFFTCITVWLAGALFGQVSLVPLFAVFSVKAAGDLLLTGYGVLNIGRPGLMLVFPLAECIHVPYIIVVVIKGLFGSFEWRGRRSGAVNLECGDNT